MTEILLVVLLILALLDVAMTGAVWYELIKKHVAAKAESRLHAAMDEEAEEARRSRSMDEGFDNLMRFSVRGHDGFGGTL